MSTSETPVHPFGAVVARLRSAGCVFAEEEARLLLSAASTPDSLAALVDRRVAGEPLEHLLGWAEFCGLRVAVDPAVFVPRKRTEFLVHQAAALVDEAAPAGGQGGRAPRLTVVDLCCGSGALGAALAATLGDIDLHAADVDPAAVRCARRNVAAAGGRVYPGDLYEALPGALRGKVDLLVANAPYVPTGAVGLMPPEARLHEPLVALDGGPDGLDVLGRVIAGAPEWLAPGGHLVVESSESQSPLLAEAATRAGLAPRIARSDELAAVAVLATRRRPDLDSYPRGGTTRA